MHEADKPACSRRRHYHHAYLAREEAVVRADHELGHSGVSLLSTSQEAEGATACHGGSAYAHDAHGSGRLSELESHLDSTG